MPKFKYNAIKDIKYYYKDGAKYVYICSQIDNCNSFCSGVALFSFGGVCTGFVPIAQVHSIKLNLNNKIIRELI